MQEPSKMKQLANSDTKPLLNVDNLPYPAQKALVRNLRGSSDDIINAGLAFPGMAQVAELSKSTWIIDKIFPLILKFLEKNDVLNCRLVCFTWIQVVDKIIQNLGLSEPNYATPKLSSIPQSWFDNAFGFRSVVIENFEDASAYLDMMSSCPKNPLLSRCIQINEDNDENPQFWPTITRILEKFGNEIWKLGLCCSDSFPQGNVFLRDILTKVPNVKMLRIEFHEAEDPINLAAVRIALIERDLTDSPLPPLPNLRHLDWYMCGPVYDALLPRYSNQLTQIEFTDDEFLSLYDSTMHGTFPCVKSLVVFVNEQEDLYKFMEFTSPLQTITILCVQRFPLHLYLLMFHTFASTLESFNIEFEEDHWGENEPWENASTKALEFPVLKSIRFENPDPDESLDALLLISPGPKTLKFQTYTKSQYWEDDDDDQEQFREYQLPLFEYMDGESIQIHGYLENMYESKIWERMPGLETFHVDAYNPENEKFDKIYKRNEMNVLKSEELALSQND